MARTIPRLWCSHEHFYNIVGGYTLFVWLGCTATCWIILVVLLLRLCESSCINPPSLNYCYPHQNSWQLTPYPRGREGEIVNVISASQRTINHVLRLLYLTGSVVNKPLESRWPRSLILVHNGLVNYYYLRRDGTAITQYHEYLIVERCAHWASISTSLKESWVVEVSVHTMDQLITWIVVITR